jgi:hypothetical protein
MPDTIQSYSLQFFKKLKWRVILTHLVAVTFLLIAARMVWTYYFTTWYIDVKAGRTPSWPFPSSLNGTLGEWIAYTNLKIVMSMWGFAFLLSLILNVRMKTFWLNSLIAAFVAFIVSSFYNIHFIRELLWTFGDLFYRFGFFYDGLANISLFVALGLFIFFSK